LPPIADALNDDAIKRPVRGGNELTAYELVGDHEDDADNWNVLAAIRKIVYRATVTHSP